MYDKSSLSVVSHVGVSAYLLGEPGCVAWLAAPAALEVRPDGPAMGNKGFIEADAPT